MVSENYLKVDSREWPDSQQMIRLLAPMSVIYLNTYKAVKYLVVRKNI